MKLDVYDIIELIDSLIKSGKITGKEIYERFET